MGGNLSFVPTRRYQESQIQPDFSSGALSFIKYAAAERKLPNSNLRHVSWIANDSNHEIPSLSFATVLPRCRWIQMSKATLAGRWCEMKQSQFVSPPSPKTSCNSSPTSRTSGTLSLVFPEPPAPWRRLEPCPVTGVRDGYITGNAVKQPRQIDTRDVCFSRPVNNQLKTSYIILHLIWEWTCPEF